MTPTETARRSIGATRNPESERAILEAARELLAEKGLSGFSIEAVARRARAGKPTIYRWWPDKTRLLLAVYTGIKRDLVDPDTGSLEGDIAGFLRNIIGFWRDTEAGRIFRSVLAESQNDASAHAALVAYHLERRRQTARLFARPYPGATPLELDAAEHLAELVVAFALAQLMLGSLELSESDIDRIAAQFARGAGR
jgi:AcrR family transcriptional regulator